MQLKQPLGCPKPADLHKDLIFSLLSDSVFGFFCFVLNEQCMDSEEKKENLKSGFVIAF